MSGSYGGLCVSHGAFHDLVVIIVGNREFFNAVLLFSHLAELGTGSEPIQPRCGNCVETTFYTLSWAFSMPIAAIALLVTKIRLWGYGYGQFPGASDASGRLGTVDGVEGYHFLFLWIS